MSVRFPSWCVCGMNGVDKESVDEFSCMLCGGRRHNDGPCDLGKGCRAREARCHILEVLVVLLVEGSASRGIGIAG